MADTEVDDEPTRKGRSNMIITYETLNAIHSQLTKQSLQLDALDEKMDDVKDLHVDHEIRIRALELSLARASGSTGMAQWATPILLTVIGVVLGLLNYIKP